MTGETGSATEAQEYFARNKRQMIGITALLVRRCPQYGTIGDLFSDIYVQLGRSTITPDPVKFPGLVYRIGYRILGERMKRVREHVIWSLQGTITSWSDTADPLEFVIPDSKQEAPYNAMLHREKIGALRRLIAIVAERIPQDQLTVLKLLIRNIESGRIPKQKEVMKETGFSRYTVGRIMKALRKQITEEQNRGERNDFIH